MGERGYRKQILKSNSLLKYIKWNAGEEMVVFIFFIPNNLGFWFFLAAAVSMVILLKGMGNTSRKLVFNGNIPSFLQTDTTLILIRYLGNYVGPSGSAIFLFRVTLNKRALAMHLLWLLWHLFIIFLFLIIILIIIIVSYNDIFLASTRWAE